ncbi:hypothetical protein NQ314_018333 [Rhamnusium bicolor]|uniref:Gem-associated protein 8 n=1 Tax=Rhamnusium bicolor TaxID=1586634 RepID=A0AAV8WS76_9CUCU|nr:hypothetical protein NQ314_018333 [Rhamnusium bicolor]
MADSVRNVGESLKLEKSYKRKIYRRPQKNTLRRIRRRRSKVRYYRSLKRIRYNKKTEDLCSAVQVFDISDMEWAPACSSSVLPIEVTEWQKQDQITYWKSRAISLELENRMLHEHLCNVYAKTIEEYSQYKSCVQDNNVEEYQKEIVEKTDREDKVNAIKKNEAKYQNPVSPKQPEGKNRIEEMKKIYGDMAQKIMGMETALQLNYERHIDQSKPPYWPSIPLRLTF